MGLFFSTKFAKKFYIETQEKKFVKEKLTHPRFLVGFLGKAIILKSWFKNTFSTLLCNKTKHERSRQTQTQ